MIEKDEKIFNLLNDFENNFDTNYSMHASWTRKEDEIKISGYKAKLVSIIEFVLDNVDKEK